MKTALRLVGFGLRDLMRGRWLVLYTLLLLVATEGLLRIGGSDARALLSLSSLVLFVVPLVGLVFGVSMLYEARDFHELLLAQPLNRRQVFAGAYGGLVIGLSAALALGLGTPFLLRAPGATGAGTLVLLLASGVLLTCVFVALAFLIALRCREKTRGLAAAIGVWLLATVVYDGFVLTVAHAFAAYPLERAMIGLLFLNPVDLARLLILIDLDVAALMGYTGAVFQRFFGTQLGMLLIGGVLTLWLLIPAWLGMRRFTRRDF